MASIVLFVRKRERIMNRRFSFRNEQISRSRSLVKQYKAVTAQASLYVGSFAVVWVFPGINSVISSKSVAVLILTQFFLPLQGFFNCLIYFWPRFVKTKEEHSDKSICWILNDMIFTKTLEKEQRRVQVHAQQRRRNSLVIPSNEKNHRSLLGHSPRVDDISNNDNNVRFVYGNVNNLDSDVERCPNDNNAVYMEDPQCNVQYEPLVRLQRIKKSALVIGCYNDAKPADDDIDSLELASLTVQAMFGADDSSTDSVDQRDNVGE
jgi:hypothetical protein